MKLWLVSAISGLMIAIYQYPLFPISTLQAFQLPAQIAVASYFSALINLSLAESFLLSLAAVLAVLVVIFLGKFLFLKLLKQNIKLSALVLSSNVSIARFIFRLLKVFLLQACVFLLLAIYAQLWLAGKLASRVPLQQDGALIEMTARIASGVERDEKGACHFLADVILPSKVQQNPKAFKTLKLSWYPSNRDKREGAQLPQRLLKRGQVWRFTIKLKAFRNFYNPAAFDYEAYMLQQGVDGRGYVKGGQRLLQENISEGLFAHLMYWVEKERHYWIGYWQKQTGPVSYLMPALIFGEHRYLPQKLWQNLQGLAAVHMFVVSGLHVALLALLVVLLIKIFSRISALIFVYLNQARSKTKAGASLGVVSPRLFINVKALLVWWLMALVLFVYVLFSGWGVSGQRALVMVLFASALLTLRIKLSYFTVYLSALFLVLLFNPLVVTNHGFWFSFIIVASLLSISLASSAGKGLSPSILMSVSPNQNPMPLRVNVKEKRGLSSLMAGFIGSILNKLMIWSRLQSFIFVLSLALLPLFAQYASIAQWLFNLVIVPIFSLLFLPLIFILQILAVLGLPQSIVYKVQQNLIDMIEAMFQAVLDFSDSLLVIDLLNHKWLLHLDNGFVYLLIFLLFYCLLPKAFPARNFAILLVILMLLSVTFSDRKADVRLAVWDVGQGLSVWLNNSQNNEQILFDTGDKYGQKFSLGSAVIAPALRYFSQAKLPHLIISHSDRDHASGAEGLLQSVDVENSYWGQIEKRPNDHIFNNKTNHFNCHKQDDKWRARGASMRWRFLNYSEYIMQQRARGRLIKDNNLSCVIQLQFEPVAESNLANVSWRALLLGDIEKPVEQFLLAKYGEQLRSEVLVVAHHGSKTSSSFEFLRAVRPKLALISAGFNNRFHHPHKSVVARLHKMQAIVLSTNQHGAILLEQTLCSQKSQQAVNSSLNNKHLKSDQGLWHLQPCRGAEDEKGEDRKSEGRYQIVSTEGQAIMQLRVWRTFAVKPWQQK